MEDNEMRMGERRREPWPQRRSLFRVGRPGRTVAVLGTKLERREMAIWTLGGARIGGCGDGDGKRRISRRLRKEIGVMPGRGFAPMEARNEGGDGKPFAKRQALRRLRRKQLAIAALCVGARLRPSRPDRVEGRAGRDPNQLIDDIGSRFGHGVWS